MIASWVTGFVIGSLFGGCGIYLPGLFNYRWFLLVGLLTRSPTLILIISFFWGVSHNPPQALQNGTYEVVATVPVVKKQPLIVRDLYGNYFRTFGEAQVADLGNLRVINLDSNIFETPSFFETSRKYETPAFEAFIRGHIQFLSDRHGEVLQRWLVALVIGDLDYMDRDIVNIFKWLGIFHLLAVSGMHITIFAQVASWILLLIPKIFYATRIIKPHYWVHLYPTLQLFALCFIGVYSVATGMSAATQRAFILFAIFQSINIFQFQITLKDKLLIAFFVQSLFFPVSLLSSANLMSWLAFLLVLQVMQSMRHFTFFKKIWTTIQMQMKLTLYGGICFGNICILSVLANLLVVPVFGISYVAIMFCLFFLWWWDGLFSLIVHGFLIIEKSLKILFITLTELSDFTLNLSHIPTICQWLVFVLSMGVAYKSLLHLDKPL